MDFNIGALHAIWKVRLIEGTWVSKDKMLIPQNNNEMHGDND